jgi:hypothetical protein
MYITVEQQVINKMGKRKDPMEKVSQRSIGFHFRQILFFNKYDGISNPEFKPDIFCRDAIDKQIEAIEGEDSEFLTKCEKEVQDDIKTTN